MAGGHGLGLMEAPGDRALPSQAGGARNGLPGGTKLESRVAPPRGYRKSGPQRTVPTAFGTRRREGMPLVSEAQVVG